MQTSVRNARSDTGGKRMKQRLMKKPQHLLMNAFIRRASDSDSGICLYQSRALTMFCSTTHETAARQD